MLTRTAIGEPRLALWQRVREYAVPPTMIDKATARRSVGDWGGACAAAGVDVEFDLRALARSHGHALAARLRSDLRHLAPDLLRWHLPRTRPDGLLRPGLTLALARYTMGEDEPPVQLVARTPPAWADACQRIGLALWSGRPGDAGPHPHPHPHPRRRFRLDLHRHLWDARRAPELRNRCGADQPPDTAPPLTAPDLDDLPCALARWAPEAALLLAARSDGDGDDGGGDHDGARVAIRLGTSRHLVLQLSEAGAARVDRSPAPSALPVLPDAATWLPPDLELLRSDLIEADRLHPLVAAALAPGHRPTSPPPQETSGTRLVDCQGGVRHRIGLVDGVLTALDHTSEEVRREGLLAAFSGPELPCLQAIDQAHRSPDSLPDIRERLLHGDVAGALAVVENLLGPGALLRSGELRESLEAAADRRLSYGLYRSGLFGPLHGPPGTPRAASLRSHPRHCLGR